MPIDYDPAKRLSNLAKHGVDLESAWDFDFASAAVAEDTRYAYPERRFQALGYIRDRLHVMIFTPVAARIRVISLRKANARERKIYDEIH